MQTSAEPQKSSERVVVLLKPAEKRRLEKLAKAQRVSAAEILRRSLHAYQNQDEAVEKTAIAQMNVVLDGMLETLRSTREHVRKNLDNIERQKRVALRVQLATSFPLSRS